MVGRPKKQTTGSNPKKEKKSAFTIKAVPQRVDDDLNNHKDETGDLISATDLLDLSPLTEQNKQSNSDPIFERYKLACETESDINELLPYIYAIAKECETCTEMGVRKPTSTWAFLAAKPKMLTSYDLGKYEEEVSEVEQMCQSAGQGFKFIEANVLEIEIEETDFLFIDTFHTFTQLTKELELHGNKAKKFIGFHDTVTHRDIGQEWMPGTADFMNCGRGIYPAIENFLNDNPEWTKYQEFDFNNGMIILKRN